MCYSPYYSATLRRWIHYCHLADWYDDYWYGGR